MLEGPEPARAAKAGLNFIEDQQDLMRPAPLGKLANVIHRREVRPHALVGFKDHAGDILRRQSFPGQRCQEKLEAGVLGPVAVREGNLHDRRVLVDDPALLPGNAAGLLRAQRSPVEAAFRAHEADLPGAAFADAMGAGQFEGALRRFRTGCQQKDFLQPRRGDLDQLFHERGADFAGKHVVMQQAVVDLGENRLAHLGRAMPRVGHEHAAAPVQPAVAVGVVNEHVFRPVPDQRRLPAHGLRLELAQLLQRGHRIRVRQGRDDAAMPGFDPRNVARRDAKLFAHN